MLVVEGEREEERNNAIEEGCAERVAQRFPILGDIIVRRAILF